MLNLGPPFSVGPLPAVIYFALSADESLHLDPYNQPVKLLENKKVRVFSATLPFHGAGLDNTASHEPLGAEPNFLPPFIDQTKKALQALIDQEIIDPNRFAAMGLSRGAFAAAHLAAEMPAIHTLLGFAPLVSLETQSLENIARPLIGKNVRFYIGNRDTRVHTEKCFAFIHHLAELSWHSGIRTSPVELIISPSIGYKGHGTSPQTFQDGINWLNSFILQ